MSLLDQDTTRKERVDENVTELEFDASDSEEYKVEAISDSAVYAMESKSGHLPGLYYLVAWKGYPEEENTWESFSAVQHLRKLIWLFYKDHTKKLTATSPPIDSALLMAKPTVNPTAKSTTKQKWGRPANRANKQAKKNWTFCLFLHVTSPQPNQVTCLLGFHQKTSVFLLKLSHRVKRFFIDGCLSNNYPHLLIFLLQFPIGLRGFLHWRSSQTIFRLSSSASVQG